MRRIRLTASAAPDAARAKSATALALTLPPTVPTTARSLPSGAVETSTPETTSVRYAGSANAASWSLTYVPYAAGSANSKDTIVFGAR